MKLSSQFVGPWTADVTPRSAAAWVNHEGHEQHEVVIERVRARRAREK